MDELARSLDIVRSDGDAGEFLSTFVRDARSVLQLDSVLAFGLRQGSFDNQEVSHFSVDGVDGAKYRASLSSFVQTQSVNWAVFNTTRPEPEQRNRVLTWTADEVLVLAESGRSPVARVVYPQVGVDRQDQMRVVVCDGPSMLGWIGGWQRGHIDERQQELLRFLVPALRRRLGFERRTERRAGGRLGAALEALGAPAVVSDVRGRVREINSIARVMLQKDPRGFRDEIEQAAIADDHPRWTVTRTESASGAAELLMVARADDSTASRVASAAATWRLTRRQRGVLAEVAEGHANQTIAAILGISERTVEVHVTALFDRAGVDNRASLIARVHLLC